MLSHPTGSEATANQQGAEMDFVPSSTLIECARKQFLKEIQKGPDYSCTVCHRSMYEESTMAFKISSYKNAAVSNACRTHLKTISDKEWIYFTCHRQLQKGAIPPQAQVFNMRFPEESCILDDLTDFESRLLA